MSDTIASDVPRTQDVKLVCALYFSTLFGFLSGSCYNVFSMTGVGSIDKFRSCSYCLIGHRPVD